MNKNSQINPNDFFEIKGPPHLNPKVCKDTACAMVNAICSLDKRRTPIAATDTKSGTPIAEHLLLLAFAGITIELFDI